MREIKFRGKRLENGEWVYGDLVQIEGSYIYDYDIGDNGVEQKPILSQIKWNVNPETVGQYTGLKDKNGKEIYEGDILSWEGYPPAIVVFIEGTFSVFDSISDDTGQLLIEVLIGAEITGNIHDNPELLETGK